MTQEQWEEQWPKFVQVACEKIIPGLMNEEVELEIFELLR